MAGKSRGWRDYQERAAALLREMGFVCHVEEVLEGARGKHEVDVVARTTLAGVDVMWIVECKYWKSAIPKAHALTLAQIAQDTGADRAVLLSETSFQAGAIAVSNKTNVLLTSLDELRAAALDSIAELSVRDTLNRIADLRADLTGIMDEFRFLDPIPPQLDETIDLLGRCLDVTMSINAAQSGRLPVRLPSVGTRAVTWSDDTTIIASTLASAADEIALARDALRAAVAVTTASDRDHARNLILKVGELIDLGATLLGPDLCDDAETAKLVEIVGTMKSVGDCAEPLRSTTSGSLYRAVNALMRSLIDGAYPWFTDQNRTAERWA